MVETKRTRKNGLKQKRRTRKNSSKMAKTPLISKNDSKW